MDDDEEASRKRKRGLLKMYYGTGKSDDFKDPYDINEPHFQHDAFLDKMFKEKTLHELMDKEAEVVKQIRSLDSDMQTLVYENYNKFISATDTIKKMKNDFRKMEDEMNKLDSTMNSVTTYSNKINDALQQKRANISQLSSVHTLLHKLQFLFELPNRLKKCIEMSQYVLTVRYYIKARDVLNKYKHMPSFRGIHDDCEIIIKDLMTLLKELLRNPTSSTRQLTECVDLLLQLDEPAAALCEEFLTLARDKVNEGLKNLQLQVEITSTEENGEGDKSLTDILEFMDCGCNGFLGDISLVIASYNELFISRQEHHTSKEMVKLKGVATEKLTEFIMEKMTEYFRLVKKRLELEQEAEDNSILVRALDKFYRKIQSVHQLMPESGMDRSAANIVAYAAHNRVSHYFGYLKDQFANCITDTRQALVNTRSMLASSEGSTVADVLYTTSESIEEHVKSVLLNLKSFINQDVAFSLKPYFRGPFCTDDVREGLSVKFLKHFIQKCKDFCRESMEENSVPPTLLLLLCRLTYDFGDKTANHIINLTEGWFPVEDDIRQGCVVTTASQLQADFKDVSQELLNRYVGCQGLLTSQMMRKSVEARDWLHTIEPRTVRAVMKRVVEDITHMDSQVGALFEEGVRKANSSDSSRWTHTYGSVRNTGSQYNYGTNVNIDTSLMSNLQKLFTEKIEVFTSVEFSKVSVLTGIIKIALKTLLECVRLRTFNKYGLQQIQVDTHYLQLLLWRFVDDESVVHFLLDEAVNSAIHRCIEPELMEPSVVEMICEKS